MASKHRQGEVEPAAKRLKKSKRWCPAEAKRRSSAAAKQWNPTMAKWGSLKHAKTWNSKKFKLQSPIKERKWCLTKTKRSNLKKINWWNLEKANRPWRVIRVRTCISISFKWHLMLQFQDEAFQKLCLLTISDICLSLTKLNCYIYRQWFLW